MTKPYHHGDLRGALLRAGERLLDREGVGALTLRAAAREAGVSHAAPTHHFRDLTGLVTALAADGFVRFRAHLLDGVDAAGDDRDARLQALGRGYVGFARAHPGLFQLMFRSERLDWSDRALAEAGEAAFALLTQDEAAGLSGNLVLAVSRWSLVHGLATLLLDGRVGSLAAKTPGLSVDEVVEGVLRRIRAHI